MKLQTKQFRLRYIRMSDVKAYWEVMQDKETKKGFMTTPKNLKEARKEVKDKLKAMKSKPVKGETFAIIVNGEYAGYVEINHLNKKYKEHYGNVGYCIHPKFRGKGIAASALRLLVNYAFKKYKLKRISGRCRTFNKASARVLEKAGFKLEGVLRKNKWKNGKYLDDMIWARIR